MTAREVITYMESLRNDEQRQVLMRFFKTGPGDYGEGDEFLGLKVPQTREVVKAALAMNKEPLTIDEVPSLLLSKWHEVRLCGLLILVDRFGRLSAKRLLNDAEAIRGRDAILNRRTTGTWWICRHRRYWDIGYYCLRLLGVAENISNMCWTTWQRATTSGGSA